MKIIITGKTSYIGTNVKKFFEEKGYICDSVSLRDGIDTINFSGADAVIHCAALVHKKEADFPEDYERINTDLAVKTARKAKEDGVRQFVFLSSMSVYGNKVSEISKNTVPEPVTLYGKTKLAAENEIFKLADDNFTVTVLRPPMVYGKDCPGNYAILREIVIKSPVFPKTENKKSLLYIKNLCFFIFSLVTERKGGIFLPMDNKYVSTDYLARTIARSMGKKLKISKSTGFVLRMLKNVGIVKKAFGTLFYDESCADKIDFIPFEKAVEETER